jgi:hypothetical protein
MIIAISIFSVSILISVIKIETEKILKYKYLTIEVQLMWDVEGK